MSREVYEAVVPVKEKIVADSEEEATARLTARLTAAGFDVYTPPPGCDLVCIGAVVSDPAATVTPEPA